MDVVDALRTRIETYPHLFPNSGRYIHACRERLRVGSWWSPGATGKAPLVDVKHEDVQNEVSQVPPSNVWTVFCIAIGEAARLHPESFGVVDDLARFDNERVKIRERDEAAQGALTTIPEALLVAVAWQRGVSIEPTGNLAVRLVAQMLAGSPAPSRSRLTDAVVLGR